MKVRVTRRNGSWNLKYEEPTIVLEENKWDDFGYKTLFECFYVDKIRRIYLGQIKIAAVDSKIKRTIEYFQLTEEKNIRI